MTRRPSCANSSTTSASRSFDARFGHRGRPEQFDDALWRKLEDTGLARLTSTPDLGAGPNELAVVLRGLARHACAVPIAETDLSPPGSVPKPG